MCQLGKLHNYLHIFNALHYIRITTARPTPTVRGPSRSRKNWKIAGAVLPPSAVAHRIGPAGPARADSRCRTEDHASIPPEAGWGEHSVLCGTRKKTTLCPLPFDIRQSSFGPWARPLRFRRTSGPRPIRGWPMVKPKGPINGWSGVQSGEVAASGRLRAEQRRDTL